jgi:hypothetical protein
MPQNTSRRIAAHDLRGYVPIGFNNLFLRKEKMDTLTIQKQFAVMGARVKIHGPDRWRDTNFSIDVRKDKEGEFFDIAVKKEIEAMTLDVQKQDRHLLLLVRQPDNPKAKFLCGHDERHWFTCAIPEKEKVSNVFEAKQALKPKELREIERSKGIKTSFLHKRHRKLKTGETIHRQGEFMFVPMPDFQPPSGFATCIHKNEPMRRSNQRVGNSHNAEFCYRDGGTTVHVSSFDAKTRAGLTDSEYKAFLVAHPSAKTKNWTIMTRDANVYVKGKITHVEHSTVDLGNVWHKVMINTENLAKASRNVKFLD